MCCAQTTERIKLRFRVRVTLSSKHCDIIVLRGSFDPPKIGVRDTSPKFTQRALSQSYLAVYYLWHRVMQKDQIYTQFLVNMQPLG